MIPDVFEGLIYPKIKYQNELVMPRCGMTMHKKSRAGSTLAEFR
jgi:hypothetical protein